MPVSCIANLLAKSGCLLIAHDVGLADADRKVTGCKRRLHRRPNRKGFMSLEGKTLFVTGASRGIGLAIALRAAREGANVAIAAKTVEPHPKLPGTIYTAAAEIAAAGGIALPVPCDIRDEAAVAEAVIKTADRFGGIDILVNNASAIGRSEERR